MSGKEAEEKANVITGEALRYINQRNLKQATILLRQASAISPRNQNIGDAWKRLKNVEEKSSLVQAYLTWLESASDDDGKAVLNIVLRQNFASNNAKEAFELLMSHHGASKIADKLSGLLMETPDVRKVVVSLLGNDPAGFFQQLFERGDLSVDGLVSILLDSSAWDDAESKIASQKEILQLALAKLADIDANHLERAMKIICRLLAVNASILHEAIGASAFNMIFGALDIRSEGIFRSYAVLAVAKLMESAPEKTQNHLIEFITTKIVEPTVDELVAALCCAATAFPIAAEKAVSLFLSPGFLPSLIPRIESKWDTFVDEAMLELLSAACIDKACRKEIARHCTDWLVTKSNSKKDEKIASLASLVLIKVKDKKEINGTGIAEEDCQNDVVVSRFQSLVSSSNEKERQNAAEGLAYLSLDPEVKEDLAHSPDILKNLVESLSEFSSDSTFAFGALSIFSNLTTYPPVLSDKQKKMLELRAYANASKPADLSSKDDDNSVSARCKAVMAAGLVPVLTTIYNTASYALLSLIAQILLSLSKEAANRGPLAQQGTIKLLVRAYERLADNDSNNTDRKITARNAAQALARILISVNPHHAFPRSAPISSSLAVRYLISLLHNDPYLEERDLLPTFEALLALTNLASTDDETRDIIMRLSVAEVENLLLSSNVLVQRAATELICNLMASPLCIVKFADGYKITANRIHMLLALADLDDLATRRAAAGALAMLSEWDAAAEAIVNRENGITILLELCTESSEEMRYRGVACIHNIVFAAGDIGKMGKQKVQARGGFAIIKTMLRDSRDHKVISLGAECLKEIMQR